MVIGGGPGGGGGGVGGGGAGGCAGAVAGMGGGAVALGVGARVGTPVGVGVGVAADVGEGEALGVLVGRSLESCAGAGETSAAAATLDLCCRTSDQAPMTRAGTITMATATTANTRVSRRRARPGLPSILEHYARGCCPVAQDCKRPDEPPGALVGS